MEMAITVVHYAVCFILVVAIMMQAGKGSDIGAAFGAGSSQTVFGSRGPATFLNKLTIGAAVIFLFTSIWLAQLAKSNKVKSVVDGAPASVEAPAAAPAAPATEAPNAPAEAPAAPVKK